jgi:hypothetical protein
VLPYHLLRPATHTGYLSHPDIDAGEKGLFELVNSSSDADVILYYAIGDSMHLLDDIAHAAYANWSHPLPAPHHRAAAPCAGRGGKLMTVVFWLVNDADYVCVHRTVPACVSVSDALARPPSF